ncbi:sensor histidine kinase [Planosporangium sp. 12N6]|uniref:sensor histidine kinase n=1 Tax=Planosporangium spinosum TaxID=3402278 RepID=UPI003CEA531B
MVALIQIVGGTGAARHDHAHLPAVGYALLLAGPAALLVRRRRRAVALVGAVAATTAYFTLGYPAGPAFLAGFVAVIGALRTGHRRLTWVAVTAAYLTYALLGLWWQAAAHPSPGRLVTVGAWLLVAFAVGEAARVRTDHLRELARARAERERALADQEQARLEHRRRQASEERLRIARELHDVLGHHLSLINVQAGVGLHLMDDRPEQARAALAAIKQASAEALREVRSVLGALRLDDESAPRTPAPGLSGTGDSDASTGLRALVADVTAAGLPVRLHVDGPAGTLPAEVDRAAYRVVQEALTNVRRHAGTDAAAEVRVGYGRDELVITVTDDGAGATDGASVDGPVAFSAGTGIVGMRQRVEALGGEFRAGPRPGVGFEVYARFPLGGMS